MNGPLNECRMLDLTDEKGALCGKIFADLGADVVKVEPPGGDPARRIGPFLHDEPHPEKSLSWLAFNAGKRSTTLDIEDAAGHETLLKLVEEADFLVESFPPGYLRRLGLDHARIRERNPALIHISISGFGQTGPYCGFKAPDLIVMALSGEMYMTGSPDRQPLRIGVPQAYLHAGQEAALAGLMALWYRLQTGKAQHVDVSAQECVTWGLLEVPSFWDISRIVRKRMGAYLAVGASRFRSFYPCRDGHVFMYMFGGSIGARSQQALCKWIDREGLADDFLRSFDWQSFEPATFTNELADRLADYFARFFLTKTKQELMAIALRDGIFMAPVNTVKDLPDSPHLKSRGYWVNIEQPELDVNLPYPGAPYVSTETPCKVGRRAPFIGEHSREVLGERVAKDARPVLPPFKAQEVVLSGIKVVEFTQAAIAPIAGRYLADHGATVVRVESTTHPDIVRLSPPFKDGKIHPDWAAGTFANYNSNKYGITLDLKNPRGKEIALALAKWSDIFIENWAPETMEKLGLGYETVRAANPSVIYASTSQMGHTGPHASLRGFGGQGAVIAGFGEVTGYPVDLPLGPFSGYNDFIAFRYLVIAFLNALLHRLRTGRGQYIEQAQVESALHFLAPSILDYGANGRILSRPGNKDAHAAPHDAYRCTGDDRWCAIAVHSEEEWQSFCRAIGEPAWTKDSRFATLGLRKEHEEELNGLVESWTVNRTAEEVMYTLQEAGVAAGLVANAADLYNDPQFRHRGHYWAFDHPVAGSYHADSPGFRLSESPARARSPYPCLGQHNHLVSTEILGMSDEEFVEFVQAGAFA